MRRSIIPVLVLFYVTSLGAAPGPNSSKYSNIASPETSAVANTPAKAQTPQKTKRAKPYQIGTASWYGKQFDGKLTASGEPFDMLEFTAAHMTLPLGTWVKVTNLRNGRWVVLKVNDRGPVVPGRIIDVSYNAAKVLDFKGHGLARVRLDVIHPETLALNRPVASLQ